MKMQRRDPALAFVLTVSVVFFVAFSAGIWLVAHYARVIDGAQTAVVQATAELAATAAAVPATQPVPVRPEPTCADPLALLPGKETLVLRRDGMTATLVVMHDGVVRGRLFTIDLERKILTAPSRPPAGWSIGGGSQP